MLFGMVLMHLQVRGASCPWLWNRRHDATSRTQSATGPASTPQDRPAPGADYHISLQSRQAPPTTPHPLQRTTSDDTMRKSRGQNRDLSPVVRVGHRRRPFPSSKMNGFRAAAFTKPWHKPWHEPISTRK